MTAGKARIWKPCWCF